VLGHELQPSAVVRGEESLIAGKYDIERSGFWAPSAGRAAVTGRSDGAIRADPAD
jgi:hypothetical protein